MSPHLWQYCINISFSAPSIPLHRFHITRTCVQPLVYMYRVNVYKRASVHASVYLFRGGIGCPFTGSLTSRYTAGTSERRVTCSFTTCRFHVRARVIARLRASLILFWPTREFHLRSYRARYSSNNKNHSRVFRNLRPEVLGHLV